MPWYAPSNATMPGLPVASNAVRSAISTASSPVTPSFAGHGERFAEPLGDFRLRQVAERMNDGRRSDCFHHSRIRCPSAATPKPPVKSMYSRPSASQTRQPSALAQITRRCGADKRPSVSAAM